MSTEHTTKKLEDLSKLKYQKRNWLKLRVRLLEFGASFGNYREVRFYKKKDIIPVKCHISKSNEMEKYPLSTVFTIWFVISSREYNGKYYPNLTLMHFERYVHPQKQMEDEMKYKGSINKLFDKDGEE